MKTANFLVSEVETGVVSINVDDEQYERLRNGEDVMNVIEDDFYTLLDDAEESEGLEYEFTETEEPDPELCLLISVHDRDINCTSFLSVDDAWKAMMREVMETRDAAEEAEEMGMTWDKKSGFLYKDGEPVENITEAGSFGFNKTFEKTSAWVNDVDESEYDWLIARI